MFLECGVWHLCNSKKIPTVSLSASFCPQLWFALILSQWPHLTTNPFYRYFQQIGTKGASLTESCPTKKQKNFRSLWTIANGNNVWGTPLQGRRRAKLPLHLPHRRRKRQKSRWNRLSQVQWKVALYNRWQVIRPKRDSTTTFYFSRVLGNREQSSQGRFQLGFFG